MSEVMVHHLEDEVRNKLEALARRHNRSLEEEIHDILRTAVGAVDASAESKEGLGTRISHRFSVVGLQEDIPEMRGQPLAPPSFDSSSFWTRTSFPR